MLHPEFFLQFAFIHLTDVPKLSIMHPRPFYAPELSCTSASSLLVVSSVHLEYSTPCFLRFLLALPLKFLHGLFHHIITYHCYELISYLRLAVCSSHTKRIRDKQIRASSRAGSRFGSQISRLSIRWSQWDDIRFPPCHRVFCLWLRTPISGRKTLIFIGDKTQSQPRIVNWSL